MKLQITATKVPHWVYIKYSEEVQQHFHRYYGVELENNKVQITKSDVSPRVWEKIVEAGEVTYTIKDDISAIEVEVRFTQEGKELYKFFVNMDYLMMSNPD